MMHSRTILVYCCAAVAFTFQPRVKAADWPMYLYDPSHSSHPALERQIGPNNVNTLTPAWSYKAQGFGGAMTVVGGVVYIGDWAGNFHAIRASDGSLVWKQYVGMAATPGNPSCPPAIGVTGQAAIQRGVVYVPGGDSAVYALDQNTGAQIWRVPLADPASGAYIWSSVTLADNSFFLGIASLGDCPLIRGALIRFDLSDPQKPIIKYLMAANDIGAGIWSTPAFDRQTHAVYVTTGNGAEDVASGSYGSAFVSFDATTLDVKNQFFLQTTATVGDDDWGSSPTLFPAEDGTPLVAANGKDGVMYVLKRSDMTPVWTATLAQGCDSPFDGCGSLSTPAFDGATLYTGAGSPSGQSGGYIYAFHRNGQQVWATAVSGAVVAPVTVTNGLVFVSTLSGLVALDAGTGKKLWDDGGIAPLYGQPVVADGSVYAAYQTGILTAYRLPAGGQTTTDPSPAEHRLPPNPHE